MISEGGSLIKIIISEVFKQTKCKRGFQNLLDVTMCKKV